MQYKYNKPKLLRDLSSIDGLELPIQEGLVIFGMTHNGREAGLSHPVEITCNASKSCNVTESLLGNNSPAWNWPQIGFCGNLRWLLWHGIEGSSSLHLLLFSHHILSAVSYWLFSRQRDDCWTSVGRDHKIGKPGHQFISSLSNRWCGGVYRHEESTKSLPQGAVVQPAVLTQTLGNSMLPFYLLVALWWPYSPFLRLFLPRTSGYTL